MSARVRRLVPALDLACLALFVLIGRGSHDIHGGVRWYLTVLWPFVVGWFAVAPAVRLYTRDSRTWLRLVVTWAFGIALGLALRAGITDRQAISTFTIVVYVFVALETFGWRLVSLAIGRLAPARPSAAPGVSREPRTHA